MKLSQNVCLDEVSDCFENRSYRVKTRSLGEILVKPCVRSRDQIFRPIIVKLCHKFCLDQITDKFKNGSCQVKN